MDDMKRFDIMQAANSMNIDFMFREEVKRILDSGACGDNTKKGTVFAVALENIAEKYKNHGGNLKDYKNLKRF